MSVETEERPTHIHTCDECIEQFECDIEDCNLVDDEDVILCPTCNEEFKERENDNEEDYDI